MRVLRREMGVEPGAATLELFDRILKGEPASRPRSCRAGDGSATAEGAGAGGAERRVGLAGVGVAIGGRGRAASGDHLGRAGHRKDAARGRAIPIVHSSGQRGRAQPLLCGTGAGCVCAGRGMAALRCDSRRMGEPPAAATGRGGAAGAGGPRPVSRVGRAPVRRSQSAGGKLAAAAFLRVAERCLREKPQAAAAVSRRYAMVRFRFVRVAQRAAALRFRRRASLWWERCGRKKRAASIHLRASWPGCGNRGWWSRFRWSR